MKRLKQIISIFKQNYTLLIIGLILIVLLSITGIYFYQLFPKQDYKQNPLDKGLFDFREIEFDLHNYTILDGEVEFYWKELLEPNDFDHHDPKLIPHYSKIPLEWNKLVIDGKKIGPMGYATYHFKIFVQSPGSYSLKIKEFQSAFNLWINSEHVGGAGTVGTSKKSMTPSWRRQEFDFYAPDTSIDIILQISNFHHRLGGASEPLLFGTSTSIKNYKDMRLSVETFQLGLLIMLILYHLSLFHYRKKDRPILYFTLMSIFFLLRLSTTGEKLFLELFPFIPWAIAIRIEYISLPLMGLFLTSFFYTMLPGSIPKWLNKSISIIAMTLCGIIIIFPASIFTYSSLIISVLSLFLIAALFIFLFKALLQKKNNSKELFLGYFLLSITMINDILHYLNVIDSTYLLPFGLTILVFTQAFIISKNTSIAYTQVENLSKELEKHAEELEEIVAKRTKTLQIRNNEMLIQKNRIEDQADILDQTNQKLIELNKFKNKITNMMVHDLKNPLGNIIGLLRLPTMTDNTRQLASSSGKEMQDLIQNILDVTKYEDTKLKTIINTSSLHNLVDIAYRQNKFTINLHSISFENLIPKNLKVDVDEGLIIRVFSNIISNATKYQNMNGLIKVSVEKIMELDQHYYKIHIFNTGESIPDDKIDAIFDIYNQIYTDHRDHKYSTGIGLTFCKMAVEAHGGQIGVISKDKQGVDFWLTLPVTKG